MGNCFFRPERVTQGAARALLMRVYLQRAGYSLQSNGQLKRPEDSKRMEYFDAVIKEWEAFEKKGYHDFMMDVMRHSLKATRRGD